MSEGRKRDILQKKRKKVPGFSRDTGDENLQEGGLTGMEK